MKKLGLIVLFLFVATLASAGLKLVWEIPMLRAEMVKTRATGSFLRVSDISLTLTKRDGSKDYTGMILSYEIPTVCDPNNLDCPTPNFVTYHLKITNITKHNSVTTEYVADKEFLKNIYGNTYPTTSTMLVSLTVSSKGYEITNFPWKATVENNNSVSNSGNCSTMELLGNPVNVVIPQ